MPEIRSRFKKKTEFSFNIAIDEFSCANVILLLHVSHFNVVTDGHMSVMSLFS